MTFKKRPKEIRVTIAKANATESGTVYSSFKRERQGDGINTKNTIIKGTTVSITPVTTTPSETTVPET